MENIQPMSPAVWAEIGFAHLQTRIHGMVIAPHDPGYGSARRAWNLTVDQYPAVIVVADNASDIVEAVRFARREGWTVAVQSTGHGIAHPADDSLLIITSNLKDALINPKAQTAWVGAGAKWGDVLEKAQAFGLAPLLGSSPEVGVVGYTLGGGMGWLARQYGLAADSVRFFEVITADGQKRRVSQNENSDLFWGLRGGGGSFGIITGMEIQLYPVSTVYGGTLFYPAAQAKEVFARYREWIASAPDALTSSVLVMNFPPIPAIPTFLRSKSFAMVRGCYTGSVEQGEALLSFWRDWQTPLLDNFKQIPFAQVGTISNDPVDPLAGMNTSAWLKDLSDETIDTLVKSGVSINGSSPLTVTEVRHAGGAISRVDASAGAYGNRDAALILELIGSTPTPESQVRFKQFANQVKQELQPHLTGGVYMNFLVGEEARQRTKDGFSPEAYRRLKALKAQYDPTNLFSHGFDIPPEKG